MSGGDAGCLPGHSDVTWRFLLRRLNVSFNFPDVTNSWTRRTLHPSLRKWKESPASFNFPPTWYGSARKRQLEKRETDCKISSCYGTLSVLKKLKYLAPYNVRKHLAECLILSKIDYNDIVSDTIADYLVKSTVSGC